MKDERCAPGATRARPLSRRIERRTAQLALALLGCGALPCAVRADLLVIGPHPDDDIITSAGVMLRARQAGEAVWVVLMTNGDIAGEASGLQRQDEAIAALQELQVPEANVIFLGYPDGHLADLRAVYADRGSALTTAWGSTTTYGRRGVGGADYHRYAFGASAANNGENVTADLACVLSGLRPAHIFVTSEFDRHPDHSATFHFVIAALASVIAQMSDYDPTLHQTIVWSDDSAGPWPPAPAPDRYFDEPPGLFERSGLPWSARESLDVPLAMQAPGSENLKWRAIQAHASQGGNDGYIGGFLHKDEFFWTTHAQSGNRPPVPHAGADRVVAAGASVSLDGSGSIDPDGTALRFQWRQIAGPQVTLSGESDARPTLIVPTEAAIGTVLAFELKLGDGTSTSVADAVSVRVAEASDQPPLDAGAPAEAPAPQDATATAADAGVTTPSEPRPNPAEAADAGATPVEPGPQPADAAIAPPPVEPAPADSAAATFDAIQADTADVGAAGEPGSTHDAARSEDSSEPAAPQAVAVAVDPASVGAEVHGTYETSAEAASVTDARAGSGCGVATGRGRSTPPILCALFALLAVRLRRSSYRQAGGPSTV